MQRYSGAAPFEVCCSVHSLLWLDAIAMMEIHNVLKAKKKLLFAPEGGEKEENNSLRFTPFILVGFYQIFSVECVPYGK